MFLYLADLFPKAGLAPAIGDPLRGPDLRWMAVYGSSFEPALIDKSQNKAPPPSMVPYGDYDTMLATLVAQLEKGPYLIGERFTAADILWGTALSWTTRFKLVPEPPVIMAYIERVTSRPAAERARARRMQRSLCRRHPRRKRPATEWTRAAWEQRSACYGGAVAATRTAANHAASWLMSSSVSALAITLITSCLRAPLR